jgi:RNA-directed DNA polymerase
MKETQMTVAGKPKAGALSACKQWETFPWKSIKTHVNRLQMRIAKATREGHHHKVKSLQWLLTHSYYAKLLATKRITQNKGKDTPGVDGVVWKTPVQKMKAASALKRRGYRPQPLRRIYIPKREGGQRPLSIPTLFDRATQALHLMALEPVVETRADRHAYGFRPKRSCADAIAQCFIVLSKQTAPSWILEGDIKSCFDTIGFSWLLKETPMDKKILEKWLNAGYIENKTLHVTEEGTPQGGIISPCLLVNVLAGLETTVKAVVRQQDKVNVCVYADDFIITGASQKVLEDKVKPVVKAFLAERDLTLSETKTKITHIDEGFDFLGFNIRKYKGKLLIKPSKKRVKRFLNHIREVIEKSGQLTAEQLIKKLNPKIRGWCNYYRHVVAKETFNYVDCHIFRKLKQWTRRRHPGKSAHWRMKRYFRQERNRHWIFHAKTTAKDGKSKITDLFYAAQVPIERHVKIRCKATPYHPVFNAYFKHRHAKRLAKVHSGLLGCLDGDSLRIA